MQQRLEMPIGVKPAARVKRRGKPIDVPRQLEADEANETSNQMDSRWNESNSTAPAVQEDTMAAMLGSVVERRRKGSSSKKKMSPVTRHSNGFPSLQTAPVGSLVRPRASNTTERNEVILQEDAPADTTTVGKMLNESKREATEILNSMSDTDIQQHAQELRTCLNPDLIAFLTQRRKSKGNSVSFAETIETKSSAAALDETLSSIRTYEDLDAAYEAYVKEHGREGASVDTRNKDDFELACDLLRSTSPHQTLWAARCVARELATRQDDVPKLLPISLRCLLDSNITSGKSALQATYVLQSLYILMCKSACPEHVVDITGCTMDAAAMYQLYFLDDAVPKPRIRSCYEAVTAQSIATNEMGAAYTTQSSARSAQSDAEAFRNDPMWTLLSRTRILPRLATIARQSNDLPEEAWISICGMLTMLGQRSPGATTAIMEHATLLPALEERLMFERGQYKPNRSLPMVIMYCTFCRQSRHAAKRIAERTNEKIVEILSLGESDGDWRLLHRWTLILWRTLLRYGYGASIAQPILTISTPILTLGVHGNDTLEVATGFYSCFANLLNYASTCSLYAESKSPEEALSSTSIDALRQASLWLTSESSWRQALGHLQPTCDDLSPSVCSFYASVIIFLQASLRHIIETIGREAKSSTGGEIAGRVAELSEILLDFVVNPSVTNNFQHAVEDAFRPESKNEKDADQAEAASAALFTSFSGIVRYLLGQSDVTGTVEISLERVRSLAAAWTKVVSIDVGDQPKSSSKRENLELARLRWLNLKLTAFLESDLSMAPSTSKNGARILIGRLLCGEEALFAAVLNRGVLVDNGQTTLSTALATLLCGSTLGKSQLQHSRLILERFSEGGTASSGSVPLDIKTLLSESTDATVEDFLPLGDHWLWQLAAGSFSSGEIVESAAEEENCDVISEALRIILDCENDGQASALPYAGTLALGPKVYWMVCVFLRASPRDFGTASNILKLYTKQWTDDDCVTFVSMCQQQHVQHATKAPDNEDAVETDPAARKIVESNIPEASVRALEALINDVCDKFMADGPDFSFGVLCIRLFLARSFAPKIRCLVLQKLRDAVHLLTHDDMREIDNSWLESCIASGIEMDSNRDPPEIIDCLVDLYAHGRVVRSDDSFLQNLTILVLARNLILHIKTENQMSTRVIRKRLQLVEHSIATRVLMAVRRYVENVDASVDVLVRIVTGLPHLVEANEGDDLSLELASIAEQYSQSRKD